MAGTPKRWKEEKTAHELRVFREFCAASQRAPIKMTQPIPDPPDIIAEFDDGLGRVAFELVRLNHDDEMLGASMRAQASDFLAAQFDALREPQRSHLSAMYADAHVLLQFNATANPGQRKLALPFVWAVLESSKAGAKGQLFRSRSWITTCVPSELEMIYVSRLPGHTDGPLFNSQSALYAYPTQVARVIDKLRKPYSCAEPLELLAYVDGGELSFESDLVELAESVRLHLPGSAFRRVWTFEEMPRRATLIGGT